MNKLLALLTLFAASAQAQPATPATWCFSVVPFDSYAWQTPISLEGIVQTAGPSLAPLPIIGFSGVMHDTNYGDIPLTLAAPVKGQWDNLWAGDSDVQKIDSLGLGLVAGKTFINIWAPGGESYWYFAAMLLNGNVSVEMVQLRVVKSTNGLCMFARTTPI